MNPSIEYPFTIHAAPEFAALEVTIPENQQLMVEASAMASMDSHISMKTQIRGGLKRLVARESIFINRFTAEGSSGQMVIAPGPSGDLVHQQIRPGAGILLTGTSYVASTPGVEVDAKFQGLVKGFFSGESLFLLRCSGEGQLWFNTFGAIIEIDVAEEFVVDTGHIVAFAETLSYDISRVGGYKSLFFSGEGFVCRFRGEGKLWLQTRNPLALISWASAFRPVKKSASAD